MKRLAYLSGALRVSTRPQANEHGPAGHVLGTIQGFRAAGWSVAAYIAGDRLPLPWVARTGESLHASAVRRLAADALRFAADAWNERQAFRRLGNRADWAYERYGAFQSLGRPFQRSGTPWILETNAPLALESRSEPDRRGGSWQRALERHEIRTYRDCDALVVQTERLKGILTQWAGVRADKVFVVPNAVDAGRFLVPQAERKFAGPTIGFVGALRRWQALDQLLRAMQALDREGIEFHLVVVGEGEKRREWERLARELQLASRVLFAGPQPWDQMPAWIAGFDLGYSGQCGLVAGEQAYFSPLKLYEYMAAAKPVLASDHEDARRLLAPAGRGYLFAPDSLPDLKHALRRAWKERDSWPNMGRRAREVILAGHTWEARIPPLEAGLREFLARVGVHGRR